MKIELDGVFDHKGSFGVFYSADGIDAEATIHHAEVMLYLMNNLTTKVKKVDDELVLHIIHEDQEGEQVAIEPYDEFIEHNRDGIIIEMLTERWNKIKTHGTI